MINRVGVVAALAIVVGACGGSSLWNAGTGGQAGGGENGSGKGGAGGSTGVAGAGGSAVGGSAAGAPGTGVAGSVGVGGTVGAGGAAGTGVAGTGGSAGGAAECAPRLLLDGSQSLIAYFVIDAGVIAALDDRVVLVGRNAQVIK